MPTLNTKLDRAVRDLTRIVSNCELQMRNEVKEYRANRVEYNNAVAAGAAQAILDRLNAQAKFLLQHAVTRPTFVQSRINQFMATVTPHFATQADAVAAIDAVISRISGGTETHVDYINEINALVTIQNTIVNGVNNSGWTGDQVATYIEQSVADNNNLYVCPTEAAYVEPVLNITTI